VAKPDSNLKILNRLFIYLQSASTEGNGRKKRKDKGIGKNGKGGNEIWRKRGKRKTN